MQTLYVRVWFADNVVEMRYIPIANETLHLADGCCSFLCTPTLWRAVAMQDSIKSEGFDDGPKSTDQQELPEVRYTCSTHTCFS